MTGRELETAVSAERLPRRALVMGARGMLGTDLCPALTAAGWDVIAADIQEVDITDPAAVREFAAQSRPQAIVNCAAYTAVDRAEQERDIAFAVNEGGARHVAEAAAAIGAALLHISTDYVFDGRKAGAYAEDDPPHPLNVYGASKLAGEQAVRRTLGEHYICRTAWLFGPHGRSFPRTMLELASAGRPLRVINDQVGSPTYTGHLAAALVRVLDRPEYGTYHIVNAGRCTWYELAREVLRAAGIAAELTPITSAEYPTAATRPANSVLDASKLLRVYGYRLPHWRQGVAEFVARWRAAVP